MIKTTKKLLSFCLAIALIASMCYTSVVAAETTESNLSDGELGLLKMLNIITEETPELSSKIKRSELAYIVAATANSNQLVSGSETSPFYDVSPDDKYYNEICSLVSLGVISGNGSGGFNPDKVASFTDACKMFSLILGYNYAEETYPYIELARKAGILKGMKTHSQELTVGEALEFAYNTLHCYMFEAVMFGDYFKYQANENCLALERFHGLLEYKGIVLGAGGTTLEKPDDTIESNQIVINKESYVYEGGQDLLGLYSVFYIEKKQLDMPSKEIQYIYADEHKNRVVTINSDDIIDFDSEEFAYYEGTAEKTIDVTGRMDVIYNGIAYPNYVDTDFTTIDGTISFIDNNEDRKYDVIKIESYTYAIVGGVDIKEGIIYAEVPAGKVIGDDSEDTVINYYDAGRLAYLGGLKKGNVILIKESKNTTGIKKITINKLANAVNGKITAMTNEMIKIDNGSYRISPNMISDDTLRVGMSVSAYINAGRCAVVLNNQSSAFSVGYMVGVDVERGSFDSQMKILVLDYYKQLNEFECIENVKIDGTRYNNINDALDRLQTSAIRTYSTASSQWPYSQLIRYKVNGDGKITYIDTLHKSSNEDEDSLQLYAPDGTGANVRVYYSTNRSFHYPTSTDINTTQRFDFAAPATAKVWFIPNNARMDEDWYRVGHSFGHTGSYLVEAYNVGEYDRQAEYILVYFTPSSAISVESTLFIVKEISEVLHNEEVCYEIVFNGTSTGTGYIKKDLLDVEIDCGDVIRFTQNYKGDIIKVEKVFDPNSDTEMANRIVSSANTDKELLKSIRFAYGTAVAVTDSSLVQTTSIAEDVGGVENYAGLNNYTISAGTTVFVYDRTWNKLSKGSVKDIVPYSLNQVEASQIAVFTTNGNTQYIYVIK